MGVGEPATVLVLYYVEHVRAHATKDFDKKCVGRRLNLWHGKVCHQPRNFVATFYPDTVFSPLVFEELLLPHPLPLHGDHLHCLRKRGDYDPVWRHVNHHAAIASFPQPPHLPPPLPAFAGTSKVMFFSSFFRFFSDHCRDLFSPHAGFSNPPPLHHASPLKPASPAAAIASFAGTQVKLCFFSFLF